jgi:Bacterial surface proteins containing Ig-like domains
MSKEKLKFTKVTEVLGINAQIGIVISLLLLGLSCNNANPTNNNNSVAVTGVTIKPSTTILIGNTEQLVDTITPNTATNQVVIWTSVNGSVATVSSNGLVTGIAAGTSAVTAKTVDGNFVAQCIVTVLNTVIKEGIVNDIDGNSYTTVKIGNQVWTVENLRTTKYNDGSTIPLVNDSGEWENLTTPAYCYYNNTTSADNIAKFGALYNWYVVNTGKLAPMGWHVPTDSEWEVMQNYLVTNGYNYDGSTDTTKNKIAKALAATTDWYTNSTTTGAIGNNLAMNNYSGFSALPGGFRYFDGSFSNFGSYGFWWSATVYRDSYAWYRYLLYGSNYLLRSYIFGMKCGFSVRLIRDN